MHLTQSLGGSGISRSTPAGLARTSVTTSSAGGFCFAGPRKRSDGRLRTRERGPPVAGGEEKTMKRLQPQVKPARRGFDGVMGWYTTDQKLLAEIRDLLIEIE